MTPEADINASESVMTASNVRHRCLRHGLLGWLSVSASTSSTQATILASRCEVLVVMAATQ